MLDQAFRELALKAGWRTVCHSHQKAASNTGSMLADLGMLSSVVYDGHQDLCNQAMQQTFFVRLFSLLCLGPVADVIFQSLAVMLCKHLLTQSLPGLSLSVLS